LELYSNAEIVKVNIQANNLNRLLSISPIAIDVLGFHRILQSPVARKRRIAVKVKLMSRTMSARQSLQSHTGR
jgi:hypothetical protein